MCSVVLRANLVRRSARRASMAALILTASFATGSCQSAYYSTMEKFGVHKRDILVDRVKDAREDQQEAKEQFVTTFERFKALTGYDGGELEKRYKRLSSAYDECEVKAEDVRKRIASVEEVSEALFDEWKSEIGQMQDRDLKRHSAQRLDETKARYKDLVSAMKKASSAMDPVLSAFHDHVLALKHDLNARAISSLQGTVGSIEADVSRLIENMQRSIQEADTFIRSMSPA